MVALSASDSPSIPFPKYSTNLPTTPSFLRILVIFSARSVEVVPFGSSPISSTPTILGTGK